MTALLKFLILKKPPVGGLEFSLILCYTLVFPVSSGGIVIHFPITFRSFP